MDARVVAASYQPSLLSIPPGIALSALLVVLAYAAVVRGAAELRGWFLLHSAALVPYLVTMVLAPSLSDAEVAATWFRTSAALVPLSAAAGVAFRLALIDRHGGPAGSRALRFAVLGGGFLVAVPVAVTDWVVEGARPGALDIFFATPGPLAPAWLAAILLLAFTGMRSFLRELRAAAESPRRRQLRRMWIASAITMSATLDVTVAYGAHLVPVGWLLLGAGSVLALRALVLEDLLHVRAIDTRAPQLVLHLAAAVLLGWLILEVLDQRMPWWGQTIALLGTFTSVRVAVAVTTLVVRGARLFQKPRERLLVDLAAKCRAAESEKELEVAVSHGIFLATELPSSLLVPSLSDWGWNRGSGDRLEDSAAPDPLLVGWLAGQSALFADDPDAEAPAELRPALDALFAVHKAQVILPLRSRDDLLGLLVIGGERPPFGSTMHFITRAAERLSESLAHVRIVRQVRDRAAIAREVELAAQLQASYLPTESHRDLGRVRVAGIWRPATQCGGDFWAVYDVGPGRALVVIGDVTGHGVSSAMVTAAVRGACDVTVRNAGSAIELPTLLSCLDAVVRRVGAERLHMSCLVALVDATAGDIHYLSAGHAAPYLIRGADAGDADLEALVARGHSLGSGKPPPTKVAKKPLRSGDLILWYTDGLTEAARPGTRDPFGDRRLQRLLRTLPPASSPDAVVRRLLDAVSSHRAEPTFDDDITLVVARVRDPDAPIAISGEATGRNISG